MTRTIVARITLLWLAWVGILGAFQEFAPARLELARPDTALAWTPGETRSYSALNKPYLLDPFLNRHVAWDSEFYLAIAAVIASKTAPTSAPRSGNGSTITLRRS
jgi:hypothetical protein